MSKFLVRVWNVTLIIGLKGKLRTDMKTVYFYPTCHLGYDQWPQMSIKTNINLLQFLFHMSVAIKLWLFFSKLGVKASLQNGFQTKSWN